MWRSYTEKGVGVTWEKNPNLIIIEPNGQVEGGGKMK